MNLYDNELLEIKNALKKLWLKSKEVISSQKQRDDILEKLAYELFSEKLKQFENGLSHQDSEDLLAELKAMAATWIEEFNEHESTREEVEIVQKNSWWKFWIKKK